MTDTNVILDLFNQLRDVDPEYKESGKIQLDNLDWAKLVIDNDGNVVVENEHCSQYGIYELSDDEIEVFEHDLMYDLISTKNEKSN